MHVCLCIGVHPYVPLVHQLPPWRRVFCACATLCLCSLSLSAIFCRRMPLSRCRRLREGVCAHHGVYPVASFDPLAVGDLL